MLQRVVLIAALLVSCCLVGCAPVFSDLQSAKLVGEGKVELTPSASSVSYSNDGETDQVQTHLGVQGAYGLNEKTDLRFRFERIALDTSDDSSWSTNVWAFGPKIRLTENKSAFYLPVGRAFGGDITDGGDTWAVHPTLLLTHQINPGFELNPSLKALVPLSGEDNDLLLAANLGAGLSSSPERWIARPEIGVLVNPDGDGYFLHFSLGLSIYP